MKLDGVANASAAAERFFRFYATHCISPSRDTLFNFLEGAHSLNDRLKVGVNFDLMDVKQFIALKALRNFFHHHQELLNTVRIIPTSAIPISTDLLFLCLVPKQAVEIAIDQIGKKYRDAAQEACEASFHWYGRVVNINPCIFNLGVSVFERLKEMNVPVVGEAADAFRASYEVETEEGHSHYVDGRISTFAATMSVLLADISGTEIGQ